MGAEAVLALMDATPDKPSCVVRFMLNLITWRLKCNKKLQGYFYKEESLIEKKFAAS